MPGATPTTAEVVLGRGLVDATGARHRRARIVAPTGAAELALADAADSRAVGDVDELLASCVDRLGGHREVAADHVRALSRGDRARLALAVRGLLLGDGLLLTARCPAPDCGALADLSLSTAELVGDTSRAEPEEVAVDTPDGRLRVRPPTAQDEAAAWSATGGAAASAELWGRIVRRDGEQQPVGAQAWVRLDERSRQMLGVALSGLDGPADLAIVSPCPQCRAWIEVELDVVDVLLRSLRSGQDRLLAEVHCLAFHYGWSQAEILGLVRPRRLAYLELIRSQLEGQPLVDLMSAR